MRRSRPRLAARHELVVDRETKVPAPELGYRISTRCLDMGLSMNIANHPKLASVFRIAPPLTITEDELERAKKPQITQIEEMRRTNRYWLGSVLEASQEYPERLEWSRSFVDDYKNITVDEVNALAKEFLTEDTRVIVVITPKKAENEEN